METINQCPDCEKQLSQSTNRCSCGWKVDVEKKPTVPDRKCKYVLADGPCDRIGTMQPHGCKKQWYCKDHWYEAFQTQYYKVKK